MLFDLLPDTPAQSTPLPPPRATSCCGRFAPAAGPCLPRAVARASARRSASVWPALRRSEASASCRCSSFRPSPVPSLILGLRLHALARIVQQALEVAARVRAGGRQAQQFGEVRPLVRRPPLRAGRLGG